MALTRTTQHKEELSMPMAFDEAFASILAASTRIGRVRSIQEKYGRIVGSVSSGAFNMNKADVIVEVQTNGESQSKVIFTATAQEGLIPQNTAAKAISRLLEAVQ